MAAKAIILASPAGNLEMIDEGDAPLKLAAGYMQLQAFRQVCAARDAEARQAWLNDPESLPRREADFRGMRDGKLRDTDYLMLADYPIDEAARQAVATYRQALRDMPELPGFPWDGGGALTPWPDMPDLITEEEA